MNWVWAEVGRGGLRNGRVGRVWKREGMGTKRREGGGGGNVS